MITINKDATRDVVELISRSELLTYSVTFDKSITCESVGHRFGKIEVYTFEDFAVLYTVDENRVDIRVFDGKDEALNYLTCNILFGDEDIV